jgi:hypothetical protein
METLDLHGVRHKEAQLLVEEFVLLEDLPAKIITGNSPQMQEIVKETTETHNLRWEYESDYNLGAMIIYSNHPS